MNARYVQRGDSIDYIPESDVAAGDIVKVGSLVGVAKLDIKAGELGALAVVGVYEIAKAEGIAFAAGMEVGWNASTGQAVAAGASGSVKIGHAIGLTGATDKFVLVRLCQGLG